MVVFAATLPAVGVGSLQPLVDESSLYGTDKERTLFEPRDELWKDIGEQFASEGVGVNMFLGMHRPIDVASIGWSFRSLRRLMLSMTLRSVFLYGLLGK